MTIKINIDIFNSKKISGWAVDYSDLSNKVSLDLLIDGKFYYRIFSQNVREDLKKAGIVNGQFGVVYEFPEIIRLQEGAELEIYVAESETGEPVFSSAFPANSTDIEKKAK